MRRALPLVVTMLAVSGGCTCGKRDVPAQEGGSTPAASASAAGSAGAASAELSLPIAAALAPDGAVWVAGLSVGKGAFVLERREGDKVSASALAHSGVRWTPDMELRVQAAERGVAVGLRGSVGAETVRRVVTFDAAGRPTGGPLAIGAAWCATEDGVVLAEPASASGTTVALVPWGGAAKSASVQVDADRDAVLACGARQAFVLGTGEEDATLTKVPGDGKATRALRDLEDEREHQAFVFGDALGLVQIGSSGATRIARTDAAGTLGPWVRLARGVGADDDLLGLDGDATTAVLALGHDGGERCAQEAGSDLLAVRADAKGEEQLAIAQGECGHDLGPVWVGHTAAGWIVAWVERAPRKVPTDAPIVALGYRALGETAPHRVPIAADGLVFAGCAASGCRAAALERAPGTDGMTPGRIRILAYP
jgi:hypothetical protein